MNKTLLRKDCLGSGSLADVPFDDMRPLVPDEFGLEGTVGATATALLSINVCPEVVVFESVLRNVWIMEFSAFVHPRNESWSETEANRYLLDLRVSDGNVLSWLAKNGMAAQLADFEVLNTTSPDGQVVQEWHTDNQNSTFIHRGIDTNRGKNAASSAVSLWFGQAPFQRMIEEFSYDLDSTPHVLDVETTGDSAAHRVMGSRWPVIQTTIISQDTTWMIDGMMFG